MVQRTLVLSILGLALAACGGEPGPAEQSASGEELAPSAQPAELEAPAAPTLGEVLSSDPRFSSLYSGLQATGLLDELEAAQSITLFAPSNEAFDNLPSAASLDILLEPQNLVTLRTILSYHIVEQGLRSDALIGQSQSYESASGAGVPVDGTGAVLQVGAAVATIVDIETSNGVVHRIDQVLIPPSE